MKRIATCLLAGTFLVVGSAVAGAGSASAAQSAPSAVTVHVVLGHGIHVSDDIVDPITE